MSRRVTYVTRMSSTDASSNEARISPTEVACVTVRHRRRQSLFLLMTGFVCIVGDGCAVYDCFQSLRDVLGFVDHQIVFPFYTNQELEAICQAHIESRGCVARSVKDCSLPEKLSFEGFDQGIRFLCNEGRQAYQRGRRCLGSESVHDAAQTCNATYHRQLSDLKHGRKTTPQKTNLLCRHVDELITCVRDGVAKQCGEETGEFIFSIKTAIQRPVKDGFGCFTSTESVSHTPVVFIIIIAGLVFVALLLVSAILHRRLLVSRRRGRRGDRDPGECRCCLCGDRCLLCCGLGRGTRRSGRLHMVESSTTTEVAKMKISSVESESTVTLQGLSVSVASRQPLKPVFESDSAAADKKNLRC